MPFAGYDDFDACVADNSDKGNPEAYCAVIKRETEGKEAMTDDELQAAEEDPCWMLGWIHTGWN